MTSSSSSAGAHRCIACEALLTGPRCDACGAAALVRGYRVLRVIAQGELGRLYLAEDARGQRVALKELVLLSAPEAHRLQAFEREAKVLTRLSHPRVPRLLESFQEGTGTQTRLYLAQEFIEGESLLARLAVHRYSEAEARDLARKLLSVLVQLHAHVPKIIHRDIKPANLIVRPDGALFLVDLGSARELATGEARGATMTGTYGYAPLEQLAGHVTEWSDLHAVGATLLHLLTRQPPWEFLQEGKGLVPDRRLDVSEGFRRFIGRLVETDAARRFTTAREALRALDQLEEPEPPAAGLESPAAREEREVKRWPRALLLLPLLAMALWALLPRPARVSEPPTPALPAVATPPPEPTPQPGLNGGLGVQTSEPQEPSGEETGFPIHLEVDERVELESVSRPVLTFRLERVSLGVARGPRRELLLEGYCEEKGARKRCPRMTWLHVSDEEGQTPKSTSTNETHIEGDPDFDFTALVRATSRRFLITVGDPKNADTRWTFDAEARRLDVAR
ncbi:serine/threonine protein kinase [Archangium sp.]|uniref:serine/threonine protein kinase n=1 Tax=Archangium sp. TaxID=1872627 RepID=UPI00389A1C47